MSEEGWQLLGGIDPDHSAFPARARLGGVHMIVLRIPAGFRGVERACPHQQASFADASLVGGGTMVRCAQHHYTFRLSDGKGVNCPGFRIAVYEIKREGQALYGRPVVDTAGAVPGIC